MFSSLQIKYLSISMLICLALAACTTMQPLTENATNEEIEKEIKPGDEVRLVTKTGNQHFITVSSISEGYIFGEEESFKLDDIEIIEVKKPTAVGQVVGHTAAAGIGIGAAILMQALIMVVILGLAF